MVSGDGSGSFSCAERPVRPPSRPASTLPSCATCSRQDSSQPFLSLQQASSFSLTPRPRRAPACSRPTSASSPSRASRLDRRPSSTAPSSDESSSGGSSGSCLSSGASGVAFPFNPPRTAHRGHACRICGGALESFPAWGVMSVWMKFQRTAQGLPLYTVDQLNHYPMGLPAVAITALLVAVRALPFYFRRLEAR